MHYNVKTSADTIVHLKTLWGFDASARILDITPFGDLFVQEPNAGITLVSLTDGKLENVSELVEELGLPPVSVELGDEWYQLDAQAALNESGIKLDQDQCFSFVQALFLNGEYQSDNIEVYDINEYHIRIHKLLCK